MLQLIVSRVLDKTSSWLVNFYAFYKTILHDDGFGVGDSISTFSALRNLPTSKQCYQLGSIEKKDQCFSFVT